MTVQAPSPLPRDRFPVVGVLGGGQLAQMLAQAAGPLGIAVRVLVKEPDHALPGLVETAVRGDPNDPTAVAAFARGVDVLTLENEFIATAALAAAEQTGTPLRPGLAAITLVQDKWRQKEALIRAGLPTAPGRAVNRPEDVTAFAQETGWPVVLKRRHFGYDGKGNATVDAPDALAAAWSALTVNKAGLYVEAFCPFERELAVMVCRGLDGARAVYPVVESIQRDHICHKVRAPGALPDTIAETARRLAESAIEAIGLVGALGVEMFLLPDQRIVINELAPRVHNSGHYTIEACRCSQFENHLRAVLGWPLGSPDMTAPAAVMVNLLGQGDGPAYPLGLEAALAVPGARIHLYGKAASSRGRKMGHVTALGATLAEAETIAEQAACLIAFGER